MRRTFLLCLVVFFVTPVCAQEIERPKNVILLIADGFGPASATMARTAIGRPLALDAILTGSVATGATDSEVTDSAAGATAFACGIKTYNGAIAVDTLRAPCRTILEAAEERGMATGLVATSRITHATPASFASHVPNRGMEAEIATQLMDAGVEVLFGGGRATFVAEEHGGTRGDGRNLLADARERGVAVATNREELGNVMRVPTLALLADDHMAYELDRDPAAEPSLAEMTVKALDLLRNSEDGGEHGFFLMVEGSRIDHAAHENDPAGHLHDILAFDDAVAIALEFARSDGNTLVVSTADHETGGLALGRDGVYNWDPEYLLSVRSSFEAMRERIRHGGMILDVVGEGAAVDEFTVEEAAMLENVMRGDEFGMMDEALFGETIRDIVSTRAGIGWTTGGHTAVDVGLYSFGPGSELFRGYMENDEVGRRLFEALGL